MDITYTIFLFIVGLVFGSFYNVVGLRVPKGESLIAPRSHCNSCQRQLTAADLIPVLSYVWLLGKCRTCKVKLSPLYPIMELATGLSFAFAYWTLGNTVECFVVLLFISLLVIITITDLHYMIIPNKVLLFFLPLLAIGRIFSPLEIWWDSLLGAVVGFGLLFLISFVSKGGIGGGDIKLFFVIGLMLGTLNTLLTLFFAALLGMVVGAIILTIRKQGRKTPIPFAPFIAIAAFVVYFWGETIIDWYMNLL